MFTDRLKVTKLNWLYFDLDSYFATIEQHLNPALRHKPIVILPLMSDYTCAIAASFEAKQLGIKTGTKIHEAKKLCPDLICIQARPDVYTKYHHLIFTEINKYLCIDHIFSIDEGACLLTGNQSQKKVAMAVARQIKDGIKQNVGEYITCSIGIAPNRYLAKIATTIQKPNGITVISPEDIPNALFPLKLRALPGIGASTLKRLEHAGVNSVEKLYQLNSNQLEAAWGSVNGKKCWYLLRGVDLPIEVIKKSAIGQSQVIDPVDQEAGLARNIVLSLILKAARRLRAKTLYASGIVLHITTHAGHVLKTRIKISPSNDSTLISKTILKSWDNMVFQHNIIKVKKIAVSFVDLVAESKQLSFDDLGLVKRRQAISSTLDKINKQFGANAVSLGLLKPKTKKDDAIAFGHIPEGL